MLKKRTQRPKTFIREWREHRDLTQEQLGERVGRTKGWVSQIEKGTINYTQDMLERVAKALGTDVGSILRRRPESPEEMWEIWDKASPEQKAMIARLARSVLGTEQ